jgi:phage FluMu protein Com
MTIEFHCPHCDKLLKTADDKAGVSAKCPGCGEPVMVPSVAESNSLFDQSFSSPPSNPAAAGRVPASAESADGNSDAGATRDCPMCGERIKAAATRCRYCGEELTNKRFGGSGLAPHRGGLILALGIIGLAMLFLCVLCAPFGIVSLPLGIAAWVMGNNDLREMSAGRMDPSGERLTQSGKIIGIICCGLTLLLLVVGMVVSLIGFLVNIH